MKAKASKEDVKKYINALLRQLDGYPDESEFEFHFEMNNTGIMKVPVFDGMCEENVDLGGRSYNLSIQMPNIKTLKDFYESK